jgi:hypothetical protein
MSKKDNRIAELREQNRLLRIELLKMSSFIFSYSETSELARNSLFYDLWLRYGYACATRAGVFEWCSRDIMFKKCMELIEELSNEVTNDKP